jgi:dihydrofolate reductase
MKCSVFIATSVDGYIATVDNDVEWLQSAGDSNADMGKLADMGMADYMSSVDCMIMGRKCMEKISSFNLSTEDWPYGDTRIIALSNTIKTPPNNLKGKVEMYSGEVSDLIDELKKDGYKHAYIDGGATITSFLNLELINEITITQAPVLLGDGIRLFGHLSNRIKLEKSDAKAYPNEFVQVRYQVSYF